MSWQPPFPKKSRIGLVLAPASFSSLTKFVGSGTSLYHISQGMDLLVGKVLQQGGHDALVIGYGHGAEGLLSRHDRTGGGKPRVRGRSGSLLKERPSSHVQRGGGPPHGGKPPQRRGCWPGRSSYSEAPDFALLRRASSGAAHAHRLKEGEGTPNCRSDNAMIRWSEDRRSW